MEPTETTHDLAGNNIRAKFYPRRHLIAAGFLAAGLIIAQGFFTSEDAIAKRHQQTLTLSLEPQTLPNSLEGESNASNKSHNTTSAASADLIIAKQHQKTPTLVLQPEAPLSDQYIENKASITAPIIMPSKSASVAAAPLKTASIEPVWQDFTIKSGDSLALVFKRAGLPASAMYELIHAAPKARELTKIHPGHILSFALDDNSKLQSLRYRGNRLNSVTYTRTDSGFNQKIETRQPKTYMAYRSATINSSLFDAGIDAGMSANLIMELANIFGWDIDFALDIRSGDHFNLLFEEKFLDGEKIGNGKILAAEFINQGDNFKAVRYIDSQGEAHYYTPDGKSLRKAFLRAPLDFNRISSNFNPRRLHPILKTVRPHRGTDYAASRGTPVYASGKGRVITSTYNKASGNYVVIQHSNDITTKYLHLHKRKVKKGQKVSQKQLIGTVGSTGYSTAPHLHYEFLLNGVHRNPRTILQKLPKAKSIPSNELARFKLQTQPHFAQLNTFKQGATLALTATR